MSRPEEQQVSMETPTLDAGGTAHVLISGHSRFQQRSLFSFLTLSSQEGERRGMAGNSREGWVGRASCYPRCSWPGEKDRS